MDNKKIKWYETNIDEYLFNTIYDPNSLTEFVPKDKWFKMNPCRGARDGLADYDMSLNKDNILGTVLKKAYGEIELCRNVVDNRTYRFNRRSVACGGALYPNNVYVVAARAGCVEVYQYIPALNILRLLKNEKQECDTEDKVYFVYTKYYWRNWPKYKYFGYRLMQVDTGYALANLSLVLASLEMEYDLKIVSDYNKRMNDLLELNLRYEAVEGVIETSDNTILKSISELKKSRNMFELVEDWDTQPISLYNILESNVLKEKYNLVQRVGRIEDMEAIKSINRISPGGGLMISREAINKEKFNSIINALSKVRKIFDSISDGMTTFMYINKVEGLEKGAYQLSDKNLVMIEPADGKTEQYIDSLLRRKNFNLFEIPILFFVGESKDRLLKANNINSFKVANIKAGFISQLITYVMCNSDLWTHPILGYDAEIAEKIFGKEDICFLNLIPVSDVKPLDRESIEY